MEQMTHSLFVQAPAESGLLSPANRSTNERPLHGSARSLADTHMTSFEGLSSIHHGERPGTLDLEDFTCSSSAIPVEDKHRSYRSTPGRSTRELSFEDQIEEAAHNIADLKKLRRDLKKNAPPSIANIQPKKDHVLKIEKPIIVYNKADGDSDPSKSEASEDEAVAGEAAALLDAVVVDEDNKTGETRRERLENLNKSWNCLQKEMDEHQNQLLDELQKEIDFQSVLRDVEEELAAAVAAHNHLSSLPFEDQLDQAKLIQGNLEALQPRLDEMAELAELLMGDLPSTSDEINDKVSLISAAVREAIEDNLATQKNAQDALDREKMENEEKNQGAAQLNAIRDWIRERSDAIDAKLHVTTDRNLIVDALDQVKDILSGIAIRDALLQELTGRFDQKSLDEIANSLNCLLKNAKKKESELKKLLKKCISREEEIEQVQQRIVSLQKWLQSASKPPDVILPTILSSADPSNMQQAIRDELDELDHFMSSVQEDGVRFLTAASPLESEEEDSQSTSTDQNLNRWHALRLRLEKRRAKLTKKIHFNISQFQKDDEAPESERSCDIVPLECRRSGTKDKTPDLLTRDLMNHLQTLQACWKSICNQVKVKDKRILEVLSLHDQYMEALMAAADWLDKIELKVFAINYLNTCEQQLQENEILFGEMKSFQEEIAALHSACVDITENMDDSSRSATTELASRLESRVAELESVIRQKDEMTQLEHMYRKQQQEKIRSLMDSIGSLRQNILVVLKDDESATEDQYSQFKFRLQSLEGQLEVAKSSQSDWPKSEAIRAEFGHVMLIVDKLFDDVHYFLLQLGERVNRHYNMQSQFEKMLEDYKNYIGNIEHEFTDRSDKPIQAGDLGEVQMILECHKDESDELDCHWTTLSSIFDRLKPSSQQELSAVFNQLSYKTLQIKERAEEKRKRLQLIADKWDDLEPRLARTEAWIQNLSEDSLHRPDIHASSLHDAEHKASESQRSLEAVAAEAVEVQQTISNGWILSKQVSSPQLKSRVTQLESRFATTCSTLSTRRDKIDELLTVWRKWDRKCTEVNVWMTRVEEKLGKFQNHTIYSQNPAELYLKLQALMELARDMMWNEMSREKLIAQSKCISQLNGSQPSEVRNKMTQLLSKWRHISKELDVRRKEVQSARLDSMPLRQLLVELSVWLDATGSAVQREEQSSGPLAGPAATTKLHKMKGFLIDLEWTQTSLDHANQEAIRVSERVNTRRSDKSRRSPPISNLDSQVGVLNKRWRDLKHQLETSVSQLETKQANWREFEREASELLDWFETKRRVVVHLREAPSSIAITIALEKLEDTEKDVAKESRRSETSISHQSSDEKSAEDNAAAVDLQDKLIATQSNLKNEIRKTRSKLNQASEAWRRYESCRSRVTSGLAEISYVISTSGVVSGSAQSFKTKVLHFKEQRKNYGSFENEMRDLQQAMEHLANMCDPDVSKKLKKSLGELNDRWRKTKESSAELESWLERTLTEWMNYESEYARLESALSATKSGIDSLVTNGGNMRGESSVIFTSSQISEKVRLGKGIVKKLDAIDFSVLENNSEKLAAKMDNPTVIQLSSKNKHLYNLRDQASVQLFKYLDTLELVHSRHQEIEQCKRQLEDVIKDVDDSLRGVELSENTRSRKESASRASKSVDEIKLQMLKDSSKLMSDNESLLRKLNESSNFVAINGDVKEEVEGLNSRWSEMRLKLQNETERIERRLSDAQSFSEKCDSWFEYVAQLRARLEDPAPCNYEELKRQYSALQEIGNELIRKQSLLTSIQSEGNKMTREAAEDENTSHGMELRKKRSHLKTDWANLMNRVNNNKQQVAELMEDWVMYQSRFARIDQALQSGIDEAAGYCSLPGSSHLNLNTVKERATSLQVVLEQQKTELDQLSVEAEELGRVSDEATRNELNRNCRDLGRKWDLLAEKIKQVRVCLENAERSHGRTEQTISQSQQLLTRVTSLLNECDVTEINQLPNHITAAEKTLSEVDEKLREISDLERDDWSRLMDAETVALTKEKISSIKNQLDNSSTQLSTRQKSMQKQLQYWQQFNADHKKFIAKLADFDEKWSSVEAPSLAQCYRALNKLSVDKLEELRELSRDVQCKGRKLVPKCQPHIRSEVQSKLDHVASKLDAVTHQSSERLKKVKDALSAISELEKSTSFLRNWLANVEAKFSACQTLSAANVKEMDNILSEHQTLSEEVSGHASNIESVKKLSDVLLTDSDVASSPPEINSIREVNRLIESKWTSVNKTIQQKNEKLLRLQHAVVNFVGTCNSIQSFLDERRTQLDSCEKNCEQSRYSEFINKIQRIGRDLANSLDSLDAASGQQREMTEIAKQVNFRVHPSSRLDGLKKEWSLLSERCEVLKSSASRMHRTAEEVQQARDSLMTWLKDLDIRLSTLDAITPGSLDSDRGKVLDEIERDIQAHQGRVEYIRMTHQKARSAIKDKTQLKMLDDEMNEFEDKFSELQKRLKALRRESPKIEITPFKAFDHVGFEKQNPDNLSEPIKKSVSLSALNPNKGKSQYANRNCEHNSKVTRNHSENSLEEVSADHETDISPRREGSNQVDFRDLEDAMRTCRRVMGEMEQSLRCPTPTGESCESVKSVISRQVSECKSAIDAVRHMHNKLSLSNPVPDHRLNFINELLSRWDVVKSRATGKRQRLKQNLHLWHQFVADVTALTEWVNQSEKNLNTRLSLVSTTSLKHLQQLVLNHKDFVHSLEEKRTTLMSINMFMEREGAQDSPLSSEVQQLNITFDALSERSSSWQHQLQGYVANSSEVRETMAEISGWLSELDETLTSLDDIDVSQPPEMLNSRFSTLQQLQSEVSCYQPRVASLRTTIDQLVTRSDSPEAIAVKEQLYVLSSRVRGVMRRVNSAIDRVKHHIPYQTPSRHVDLCNDCHSFFLFNPTDSQRVSRADDASILVLSLVAAAVFLIYCLASPECGQAVNTREYPIFSLSIPFGLRPV